ncbi:MAG: hypothetical protein COV44_00635 [Deltaproteobacteria bacterium CG11_big_fil_rev_8_21_14_0_20_45_16]|nr:MAG: hypothetical protein COV44_00635 [Deltaproteobacteria bacterium CG11_big_fil_rev_8_21_14_0_20_45_16]
MSNNKSLWLTALGISQAGFMIIMSLVLGAWLDRKLDTRPWLSALGLIVGFIGSGSFLYRLVRLSQKRNDSDDQNKP